MKNTMRHFMHTPTCGGLMLAAALLTGCATSTPDRYYTLATPVPVTAPAAGATPLFIELAPVAVPERLARPQMLVRRGDGTGAEVQVLEQHRWTASFENELRDALASGIAARLGAIDVTKGGRQLPQPAWRIAVQVQQFDAVQDSRVDTVFSWTVRRADAERGTACRWFGSVPVGRGIEALAEGAQRATTEAAQAIARHVAALRADPGAACSG